MKVPFIDLNVQFQAHRTEIMNAIESVCENTAFAMGAAVKQFETNFAEYVGVKYAIGLNSGTAADQLAIQALIQPGDEVITTANTFIATTEAITAAGGKIVFADIDEVSYNLDPQQLEKCITPRTKVVVPVHLYGQPADMDAILEIARQHNLYVIEDSCQAHGAEYKGRKAGSLADAAAFSFYPAKNLGAFGEGGIITTNSEKIAEFARMYRDHGSREKYIHNIEGHNFRMENMQGAVLDVKLPYLDQWIEARRKHAAKYDSLFADIPEVMVPQEMPDMKHVYHLYVIRVQKRAALQRYLTENGIGSGFHYKIPLHLQKAYQHLGYEKGSLPVTEKVMEENISLPMYPEMTDDQIEYVVDVVKKFVQS